MTTHCEVLVVGGGIAGTVSAALLARSGLDVALLFTAGRTRPRPELVSPEAALHLQRLGFPVERLSEIAVRCPGVVDQFRRTTPVYVDFELSRCASAWAVDRKRLDELLLSFAANCGLRMCRLTAPARMLTSGSNAYVSVSGNGHDIWRSGFLIDATGAASTLAAAENRHRIRYDRLVAVCLPLSQPMEPAEWLHLSSSSAGWWYSLKTAKLSADAVFMTDADLLPRNRDLIQSHLRTQFDKAFPAQSALLGTVARWTVRDARTSVRCCLWRGRWLPVGDAAFTLDPLSGNGIGRALRMADDIAALDWRMILNGDYQELCQAALALAKTFNQSLSQLQNLYSIDNAEGTHPPGEFWIRRRRQ
ncbi:NAD(P)/FAD-dependent oxidoreductase [Planctomicrobium piriforme]|uniref:Dehydrogenase (Flavoprotein) n=1 Tax=Planctomicrobium piriforme TaxID=1576369 RepID=A0A1I3JDM5_9PLAN|nr:FAD-dependent monooxygenase [Planctomicrobium piriforme]SFI58382.1 Dehydrogenase (flavoprotein) [Planctomicrobium piriforme]